MKRLIIFILLLLPVFSYGQNITTIAGGATGHGGYWGEGGPATAAQINPFGGIAVDKFKNVYLASGGHRVVKVDQTTGIISTVAGTGVAGFSGDGTPATSAQLNSPTLVCVDTTGNLYIGDGNNYRIRKVEMSTGIITTFAGNGTFGSGGDGGPATAADCDFYAFTFDPFNNMIIESAVSHRIRKVDPSGMISTIAGTGLTGNSGDGGPATAATMAPDALGICTDKYGNIYFADSFQSVRKINRSTGIITRVAGTADFVGYPYSGDGYPATASNINPSSITADLIGNLYIADYGNSRIEMVDTFGIIHTVTGTGINGFSGDGGPATSAKIDHPENAVVDACGNVYIADFNNARARKVTYHASCDPSLESPIIPFSQSIIIYPNPVNDVLHINTVSGMYQTLTITNNIAQVMLQQNITAAETAVSVSKLPAGMYYVSLRGSAGVLVTKFVKE